MQKITILSESCEKALSLAPELKKRCIEEAAAEIKHRLDVNISTSIDDSNHKVRDWQRIRYGSKGGYAVIEAIANGDGMIAEEIRSNMRILEHLPPYEFDIDRFTCTNTHGDYMITQLICGENCINSVIDWTTASADCGRFG